MEYNVCERCTMDYEMCVDCMRQALSEGRIRADGRGRWWVVEYQPTDNILDIQNDNS